jgi:hypothetical protein
VRVVNHLSYHKSVLALLTINQSFSWLNPPSQDGFIQSPFLVGEIQHFHRRLCGPVFALRSQLRLKKRLAQRQSARFDNGKIWPINMINGWVEGKFYRKKLVEGKILTGNHGFSP